MQPTPVTSPLPQAQPALVAEDLWFWYDRRRPVLRGVSLEAAAAQVTMIIGASGGGKTTVLKLAKGLLTPQRGTLNVLGRRPRPGHLDCRVAYIPQQLGLVRSLPVIENTLTGALGRIGTVRSLFGLFPGNVVKQAHETLDMLGIGHKAMEPAFALSGGERQRVAIARALMQEPDLILADEFISQLDPLTSIEIMEIMRGIAERGVALVMTTHELDIVSRYADRVILLRAGEKVHDGPLSGMEPDDLAMRMRS